MKLQRLLVLIAILLCATCYKAPPVKNLPNANLIKQRTLFIGMDGVDYEIMQELFKEGYYQNFQAPRPLISTFPSDTTVGFTGILQPLNVGQVPGYEVRFYSYEKNKVIGGTAGDIYKIPIKYKYYFDSFRHQIHEKAIMYMFPGLAGKQDLINTEEVVLKTDKQILMTYMGGTDGSSHILGRKRTKRFLIYMDGFLKRIAQKHREQRGQDLRIVLFSDHGFRHNSPKTILKSDLENAISAAGLRFNKQIESANDVVTVPFGLLSGGVLFMNPDKREAVAKAIAPIKGMDVVLWADPTKSNPKKIWVIDHNFKLAYFEYKTHKSYRYVPINGDPLNYEKIYKKLNLTAGSWLSDSQWRISAWNHEYPDVGYRAYDAFFRLVENPAGVIFSTKKNYQYGSLAARIGTWAKLGHKGTHGGLFRETTWGVVMSTDWPTQNTPDFLRYDEMFNVFLPQVTNAISKLKKEVSVVLTPEQRDHMTKEHGH